MHSPPALALQHCFITANNCSFTSLAFTHVHTHTLARALTHPLPLSLPHLFSIPFSHSHPFLSVSLPFSYSYWPSRQSRCEFSDRQKCNGRRRKARAGGSSSSVLCVCQGGKRVFSPYCNFPPGVKWRQAESAGWEEIESRGRGEGEEGGEQQQQEGETKCVLEIAL